MTTKKEFIRQVRDLRQTMAQLIEAEVDGFSTDSTERRKRVDRVISGDYEFFCRTYLPHFVKFPNSQFHDWLYAEVVPAIDDKRGRKMQVEAPRGEAKSTLLNQALILFCILTGRKIYPIIIMDAYEQAALMLESVKVELEANPRIAQDFPDVAGEGRIWQVGSIVTKNNRKVEAFGSGKRLRGRRHGAHRPDLCVLDDIENDENVRKKEQRDKLEDWVKKAVLNLGPPDGSMDVVMVGTRLHHDSVLARIAGNPMWEAHKFQAILRWPDNMDLWDAWEEKLKGGEDADGYYARHKAEMDKGAEVSWADVRPLIALMKIRADSHHSFDCEFQNDPTSGDDAPFRHIIFWVAENHNWVFVGSCDPSLGIKNTARDPSAIIVAGVDRETGIVDVVVADIRRRLPDDIIAAVIRYQSQFECVVWGIEAVQFQEFFRTELVKRSAAEGIPVPARPIIPHTDKRLRIETLQPHVVNGLLRLHQSQHTLVEQLRHWPEASHDDGPDALEMVWKLAQGVSSGAPQILVSHGRKRERAAMFRGYG